MKNTSGAPVHYHPDAAVLISEDEFERRLAMSDRHVPLARLNRATLISELVFTSLTSIVTLTKGHRMKESTKAFTHGLHAMRDL